MTAGRGGAGHGAIAYRPDIDGLRAIAVAAVVLYHAALPGVPGGFVGVDIFFVISGFLIGGQIYREGIAGGFSYREFYARRARRILPAFLVLLAVCYLVGTFALTPLELKELGKEAFAGVFAVSNILFYLGGGYFAPDADRNPLLMTWSLGVEEQFYIIFPIILLLLLKQRMLSPLWGVIVLSLISFLGSLILMHVDPTAAFYLLPTRAWELGLGATLAILGVKQGRSVTISGRTGSVIALISLATLGLAITAYIPSIAFPGWYVLLPTIATVALLATSASAANRRLLGNPVMQFIGKVSYSWYLWHWPVFYLNRIVEGPEGGWHGVALVGLTLALAIVSWRIVETPLRRRVLPQGTVLLRYAAACLLVAAPGFLLYKSGGWIDRLPQTAQAMAHDARAAQEGVCLARYGATGFRNADACLPPSQNKPTLAILGDSHADALAVGIKERAAHADLATAILTKSSCAPLIGFAFQMDARPEHHDECIAYQDRAFAEVARRADIETVVLVGYWHQLIQVPLTDRNGTAGAFEKALRETVAYLRAKGKTVILVQDVPSFPSDPYADTIGAQMPLRVRLAHLLSGRVEATGRSLAEVDPSRPILAKIARNQSVGLWDPWQNLCRDGRCTFAENGKLYYSDMQHLTVSGALAATRGLNFQD
ncbi:MAG: acyltransferase family protein [Pseudomonadota bacterium]|tara:strand:- start:2612 stop:4576 length:1965 start_codon:yes stop_codon:yes gene_type:complete